MYKDDVSLFIDGQWRAGEAGQSLPVVNPATDQTLAGVAKAEPADLECAVAAAKRAFAGWRRVPAFERSRVMRQAASILRERCDTIARLMTLEQGKPLLESRAEINFGAEIIEWFAEEARRVYARGIPSRDPKVRQYCTKEPVGIVLAFSPWNFPIVQAARKISLALAAGCTVILKGPEEAPASCAELVRCFADAGVPAGTLNLVYGVPAEISLRLVPHPDVSLVSFTGSVPVGKQLAALAGAHMKRTIMELGGHAPVIICDDVDVELAAERLCVSKFRNAGQVCVAPTRFIVHEHIFKQFVDEFVQRAAAIRVGDGLDSESRMGPLVTQRRLQSIGDLVADAAQQGAQIVTGGERIGSNGHFFAPTVAVNPPRSARAMNEEPFGPLALMVPFARIDQAVAEANRLPFGLAAFAFTRSLSTAMAISEAVQSGMLSINHHGLGPAETPFGGIKDSGYGNEGGPDAIEAYLTPKFATYADL